MNTRTLRTDERLIELQLALGKIKWDIIGLSEVRKSGEEIREFTDFIFYFKGEIQGRYGIGFLVRRNLKKYIEDFIGKSDRIAVLNLVLPGTKITMSIVQTYAPTEQATKKEKNLFYKNLTETMREAHKNVIVMGDFNGQVGTKSEVGEYVLGKYGSGKRSENGQRLINFCYEHNFKVMNSFFKNKTTRKWTWISPNGKTKNEIDYIITNKPKIFNNVTVINNLNFNSDHRLVRGTIACKNLKHSRRTFNTTTDKTISYMTEGDLKELKHSLVEIKKQSNVQDKYNTWEQALQKISKCKNKNIIDKLGTEARASIKQRNEMIKNRKDNRAKIADISKKILLSIRDHRRQTWLHTVREQIKKKRWSQKSSKTTQRVLDVDT